MKKATKNEAKMEFHSSNQSDAEAVGGGGDARAERAGAPLPPPQAAAMGWSVTPHRQITSFKDKSCNVNASDANDEFAYQKQANKGKSSQKTAKKWAILSQGLDTLDLGFGVCWGVNWGELSRELDQGKQRAAGKNGIVWKEILGEKVYIYPSGKNFMYRYHLQTEFGHIFIGKSALPRKDPNVYVSFYAWRLWTRGWRECLTHTGKVILALGGKIAYIKPSRVDLCVDCHIPGGLTTRFLETHIVSHAFRRKQHSCFGILETFYLGSEHNSIQLRIYDKTKQAKKDETLILFQQIWGGSYREDVWRFEFQLRRPYLNAFEIHTMADLLARLGTIWQDLTNRWCTLRYPSAENTSRRMVHPLWVAIQDRVSQFGGMLPLVKGIVLEPPDMASHLAHIEGRATSIAAMCGHEFMDEALDDLTDRLRRRKSREAYAEIIREKALKFGRLGTHYKKNPATEEGAS